MKHFQKWSLFELVLDSPVEGDANILTDGYNPLLLADTQRAVEERMTDHAHHLLGGAVWNTLNGTS